MIHNFFVHLDKQIGFEKAEAHCDVPCKIYDPFNAQQATLSVLRFIDLISELEKKSSLSFNEQAQMVRLVNEKEQHADKVKNEVRVIWGDFFKQPQLEKFPGTHALVHGIMQAASACKQNIERQNGEKLLELVNQFAESFWQAKNIPTYRASCPYPPSEQVVYPALQE